MRACTCALVFVLSLYGQISDLEITRVTHQQILLTYSAPSGATCRIEVSDQQDFSRLAKDVDPNLFTGSDRDLLRPETWVDGDRRAIVLGKRAAERAADGKRYSRSLQAATQYYLRLSECGDDTTIEVTTNTVPFGPMLDLPAPVNEPGAEGMYAFPSWNWFGDRNTESVVDYLTGAEIRKLQLPLDWKDTLTRLPLGMPAGEGWTNPAGATGNGVASYPGVDRATLFIPSTGWSSPTYIPSRLNFALKARVTGNATGEDAAAEICLGNETGCWTDWKRVDLDGKSLDDVTVVGPGEEPSLYWSRKGEWMIEGFHRIGMNRGIHIRKVSQSPDHTLEIDSIVATGSVAELAFPSTSYPMFCSDGTTESKGKQFVLCFLYPRATAPRIHAVDVNSGDSFYIGPAYFSRGVNGTVEASGNMGPGVWDREDPRHFYTYARASARVYRCTIAAEALDRDYTGDVDTQPSSISCENMTGSGYTLNNQAAGFGHPGWTAHWTSYAGGRWALEHMQNGKLVFAARGQQDMGGWIAIFDPKASAPDGCNSCTGKLVALSPFGGSAVPKERKFCPLHVTNAVSDDFGDWVSQGVGRQTKAQNSYYWGGPWHIRVKRYNGDGQPECDLANQDCSIPPGHTTFQILPQGPNGTYDFYDAVPGGPDDGIVPLEEGDLLLFTETSILEKSGRREEYLEVVAVDRIRHTVTVRRGTDIFQSPWIRDSGFEDISKAMYKNQPVTLPAGADLYGICRNTALNYNGKGIWLWNFSADPYGTTYVMPAVKGEGTFPLLPGSYSSSSGYASPNLLYFTNFGNHGTHSSSVRVQYGYLDCPNYYKTHLNVCLAAQTQPKTIDQINSSVDVAVNIMPTWAGQPPANISYGSHIKLTARSAAEEAVRLSAFDVRAFISTGQRRGNLVPDAMQVYQIPDTQLRRKHFPTVATSSPYALRDISGPADCSADPENSHCLDDRDMYTYCVALHDNECRGQSRAGDVYVNSGTATTPLCQYTGSSHDTVASGICVHDAVVHTLGVIQTPLTQTDPAGVRTRLLAMHGVRPWNQSQFNLATPLTNGKWSLYMGDVHGIQTWNLIKVPPLPESASETALMFDRLPVEVNHPSAASFRIKFGYAEYGDPRQYYCTTRQEACVIDKSSFTEAAPFQWASEPLSSIPCNEGQCRAEIPRVPGKVVFAEVDFYDTDGGLVESRPLPPM